MTDIERGWLAGIIDGEGTICCQWVTAGGHQYLHPRITVYNNNPQIVETARRLFEEITEYPLPRTVQNKNGGYSISVTRRKDLIKVLDWVLPDLIGKSEQAQALLEHFRERIRKPNDRPARRNADEKFFAKMQGINARFSLFAYRRMLKEMEEKNASVRAV